MTYLHTIMPKLIRRAVQRWRGRRATRRQEWQTVLDAEMQRWSAMSSNALLAALSDGVEGYEVERNSKAYNVEVELLENTDICFHVAIVVDDGTLPASMSPLTGSFIREKPAAG
jgi:hypothetical protein